MNPSSNSLAQNGSKRISIALILGLLSAFGPFSLDMYLPALPMVAEDLHTSAPMAQLSLTACLLGLSLGQLFIGPISDVRGRKLPLAIGLALYAIVSVLCVYSPSAGAFIALRFVQGLAGAAGIVISRAVARDLASGSELTRFFSLLMLVNGAAPVLAPVAGGQLLRFTDWRGVFVALGLLGVVSLLAALFGLPESLPAERRARGGIGQTLRTFRRIAGDREFMGYALPQGFVTAAMFAYISGSPFVLQGIFGVSPQTYSLIFACNGLGIILFSQAAGRLAGRVDERRLLAAGLGLASAGGLGLLAVLLLGGGLWAVLPLLFVVVSCVGLVGTASFPLAMRKQSESAGSASALLGVLSFVFGGIVSPLVGIGGEQTAVPMGVVMAAANVLAIALYYTMVGRKKRDRGIA